MLRHAVKHNTNQEQRNKIPLRALINSYFNLFVIMFIYLVSSTKSGAGFNYFPIPAVMMNFNNIHVHSIVARYFKVLKYTVHAVKCA